MQQIPFNDLFKSVVHVSGEKLTHSQEHFLAVYTAFGTIHQYCCRPGPILSPSAVVTGQQQYRCIIPKAVYTVKKCSRGWASFSPETCRADLKRSINGICCILLVAYIGVLMMHGITNI